MSKTKFLAIVVVALMMLNLGLIIAFILNGPPPPRQNPEFVKNMIIKKLQLNDDQIAQYEGLIAKHRNQIQEKDAAINSAKKSLYQLLRKEDYSQRDSLIKQIVIIQTEIEQINFKHFSDLKTLCNGEQLKLFYKLTDELGKLFGPRPD